VSARSYQQQRSERWEKPKGVTHARFRGGKSFSRVHETASLFRRSSTPGEQCLLLVKSELTPDFQFDEAFELVAWAERC
jgi:hypothetical protein